MPEDLLTPETLAVRELLVARRDEFQKLLDRYGATNPRLFGSVARGTAHSSSGIDILVEMDPSDGNLLMRASGLMEETRALFDRDDIDIFPVQLLKRPISTSALADAVALCAVILLSASLTFSRPSSDASGMSPHSAVMQTLWRWQRARSSAICRSSAKL